MLLFTQYYRPPFPETRYWFDDLYRIKDSGFDGIQLWCIWGWIESSPDVFEFDDYDRIMTFADKVGLKVVLSTIAEIHPYWIHRVVPNSELIDNTGQKVISSSRCECNVGLTPGGCFDHPEIRSRMESFLSEVAKHFSNANNLIAWDCWNELRWAVQASGHVCFCQHTIGNFRKWLQNKYQGLDNLNVSWKRKYSSWDDIFPDPCSLSPYVSKIEFQRFLMGRACEHAKMRYDAIKRNCQKKVIAHGVVPSFQNPGLPLEQALSRGNDWEMAKCLDGFGCSHFPFWGEGFNDFEFGVRLEGMRSASGSKPFWVSELQGGTVRDGIIAQRSVESGTQKRWIINAVARGAEGLIFWCWRDEVFGRESSGFGLDGWDGCAHDRLESISSISSFLKINKELFGKCEPELAKVGILFSPDNYFLDWADSCTISRAADSVNAYAIAFEKLNIAYEIIEVNNIECLSHIRVLFLPWCLVLPSKTMIAILDFIRAGGHVFFEAETDAFDELGFYRYPDERPFLKEFNLHDLGRRQIEEDTSFKLLLNSEELTLFADQFVTPIKNNKDTEVLAVDEQNQPVFVAQGYGNGRVYMYGSFLGTSHNKCSNPGFENLLLKICRNATINPNFKLHNLKGNVKCILNRCGLKYILWLINSDILQDISIEDVAGIWSGIQQLEDIRSKQFVIIKDHNRAKIIHLQLQPNEFVVFSW